MKHIKNIVFDLGGVLVDLAIEPALKAFAQLGLNPLPSPEAGWGDFGQVIHRMDCGDISTQEFLILLRQRCRPGVSDEDLTKAFNRVIVLPRQRMELLLQLRKQYHLYLLSNLSQLHWEETCRQAEALGIPFAACFDGLYLSYQLRMAKPDTHIYQHLIQDTGIIPEETLYLDDLPENIEAGLRARLQSVKIAPNHLEDSLPTLFSAILR